MTANTHTDHATPVTDHAEMPPTEAAPADGIADARVPVSEVPPPPVAAPEPPAILARADEVIAAEPEPEPEPVTDEAPDEAPPDEAPEAPAEAAPAPPPPDAGKRWYIVQGQ